jgi:CspA family cold shock protein
MNQHTSSASDSFTDTWGQGENGNKFVFTVELKRRLVRAGLPVETEYLDQLADVSTPVEAPRREEKKSEEFKQPEMIQIDPETGKFIGRLKWYNPIRGYGFISRGGGEDIFFHKTSTIGNPDEFEEGQWVLYEVEERAKGPEAAEVEPYLGEVPEE